MQFRFRSVLILMLTLLVTGCAGMKTGNMPDSSRGDLYDGALAADMLGVADALTPRDALSKGDSYWRRGEADRALLYFIRALELDSQSSEAVKRIARVHEKRNNAALAERAWNEVLAIEPDDIAGLEGTGLLRLEQRRYPTATTLLTRALSRYDAQQALSEVKARDIRVASSGKAATETQPATSTTEALYLPWMAANGLGVMADLNADYETAVKFYQRALAMAPGQPMLLNNLGYSHAMAGQLSKAEAYLRQSLNARNDYARARRNLALVLARQDKPEEAVRILKGVMDYAEASNDVGYLMMLDNHEKEAEQLFRQAMDASPTYYVQAWDNLAQLEDRMNQSVQGQVSDR